MYLIFLIYKENRRKRTPPNFLTITDQCLAAMIDNEMLSENLVKGCCSDLLTGVCPHPPAPPILYSQTDPSKWKSDDIDALKTF